MRFASLQSGIPCRNCAVESLSQGEFLNLFEHLTDRNYVSRKMRAYLRAPLNSEVLYLAENHVFSGKMGNISEGGCLIESLSYVPEAKVIPIMINLPLFPDLAQKSRKEVLELAQETIRGNYRYDTLTVRCKAKIVRSFEGMGAVDRQLVTSVGCQFVVIDEIEERKIREYVSLFGKNVVYLLSLLQNRSSGFSGEVLRAIGAVIGYPIDCPLPVLHTKVVHDYQSLESL